MAAILIIYLILSCFVPLLPILFFIFVAIHASKNAHLIDDEENEDDDDDVAVIAADYLLDL